MKGYARAFLGCAGIRRRRIDSMAENENRLSQIPN
jgi:hypothetical protein